MDNGELTLLVGEDRVTLEVHDRSSRERVIKIDLTPEQFCKALSRHAHIPCNINYGRLENVGKKLILDHIKFPMPKCEYENEKAIAYQKACEACPDGWKVDSYFGSKDSFGWNQDGTRFARATIRKWVTPGETDEWKDSCNQN